MTTTDRRADDRTAEAESDDGERPRYSELDPETAAKCGLWL